MLRIALVAVVLALPVPTRSAEATAYLAPRGGATASATRPDEAPPDVESPVDWRRGVLGTDETDGRDWSPH